MQKLQNVISSQIKTLRPDQENIIELNKISKDFVNKLKEEISKSKINADVFIGGSFAKGTLIKSDNYDIDVFVRFIDKYDSISDILQNMLKRISHINIERVHGSRDYFIIRMNGMPGYFEVIPVIKIRKPTEEKNVTDLTYFHGPYVRKR